MDLIALADIASPPGIPAWFWGIVILLCTALGAALIAMLPAWLRETTSKTAAKADSKPPQSNGLDAIRTSIEMQGREMRDELRDGFDDTFDALADLHGRVVRLETIADPNAAPAQPLARRRRRGNTGSHQAVSAVQLTARKP